MGISCKRPHTLVSIFQAAAACTGQQIRTATRGYLRGFTHECVNFARDKHMIEIGTAKIFNNYTFRDLYVSITLGKKIRSHSLLDKVNQAMLEANVAV